MFGAFTEPPRRFPLSPGVWRIQRRPGSELRTAETDVLVTDLPFSHVIIVTTADGKYPLQWGFLQTHFLLSQAVRLDRLTGQPVR